jgi:putative metalloenzyme radical SAM/SPASM domain maturase
VRDLSPDPPLRAAGGRAEGEAEDTGRDMSHPSLRIVNAVDRPALRPHPSKLFVEVTTRCNLRCAMCPKEAPGKTIAEGDMSRETFDRLAPAFPHLEALVLNGIGEPLLHRELEAFIETARRSMPASGWIGFQTNGQLLGPKRAASLVSAGVDRICLSADAVSPDMFRELRRGGRQEAVEAAVSALHDAARERGRPISVGLEFVAMRSNLHQLPELVRWAARNRIGFVIVTHMLPYDSKMAAAVAFDTNTDRALQLYREWTQRAAAEGVDLGRYFEVFMKFRPPREDQRVIEFVARMVADASAQGVSLNAERLLACDGAMLERVSESFAEAEEIARGAGVDLRLPATVPTHARRCEFVEGGGSFVSWDGRVHPCYFLWHQYTCYLGGVVKHVRPVSFGSVAEQDALALWNRAEARAFREGVVKYDFPFCYDCSVALCDYVQGEEFTQDCHVGSVPCGACLWCTGLFQCLQ